MQKILPFLLITIVLTSALALGEDAPRRAPEILQRYLEMPNMGIRGPDEWRGKRLEVLKELTAIPDEAVREIAAALPRADQKQRVELIEVLGWIPTRGSADLLISLLKDPAPPIRSRAVHSLRLLACRIHRSGMVEVPKGADFPPKVDGLVPHLITAAGDKYAGIREIALLALADTRDPAVVAVLRGHLDDPAARVRLTAACLLTEFDDDSGLSILKSTLHTLRINQKQGCKLNLTYYADAQQLIASLQRITGVNLGEIPGDPALYSSTLAAKEAAARTDSLVTAWDDWIAEQDKKSK